MEKISARLGLLLSPHFASTFPLLESQTNTMTKIKLTTIFLLFSFFVWGQNIDFDSIKVNVQNENSLLYYEKLLYKFKFDPASMSDEELKNLYYGKNSQNIKHLFLTQIT